MIGTAFTAGIIMLFWNIGARAGWNAVGALFDRLDSRRARREASMRNITPGRAK
jgi:hypothetical protein